MTVLVTGATGHLGANLVRTLLESGQTVRAVTIEPPDRDVPALESLDVERVQGDVRDLASMRSAARGADVVYHLAARVSIASWDADEVWSINVGGVANIIEACLVEGARRLVHVSSIQALSPGRHAVPPTTGGLSPTSRTSPPTTARRPPGNDW